MFKMHVNQTYFAPRELLELDTLVGCNDYKINYFINKMNFKTNNNVVKII